MITLFSGNICQSTNIVKKKSKAKGISKLGMSTHILMASDERDNSFFCIYIFFKKKLYFCEPKSFNLKTRRIIC